MMCSSRKYPYPPQGRLTEIPRGRGVQKPNFLKESMALKWNFQRGWGIMLKNLPWEWYGYFLEQHNKSSKCKLKKYLSGNKTKESVMPDCVNFATRGPLLVVF